jgi:hypothetical protein
MRLGIKGGNRVTVAVVGYQWPDASDPCVRCAWHMVAGEASDESGTWAFRWQALACEETARVSKWLRQVADWLDDPQSVIGGLKPTLSFTEPNLAFRVVPGRNRDQITIDVYFDLEFKPRPFGPVYRRAGRPYTVPVVVDSAALRLAAYEWDYETAAYPIDPDWPKWGSMAETTTWLRRVWSEAVDDLGLTVTPFRRAVRIRDFGSPHGTVCVFRGAPAGARFLLWHDANRLGLRWTALDEHYQEYDQTLFIETLNDWGWYGEGDPPSWYSDQRNGGPSPP